MAAKTVAINSAAKSDFDLPFFVRNHTPAFYSLPGYFYFDYKARSEPNQGLAS
jgi:hypothetical protein